MAKDVEYNYTASDKTGPANDSVRRRMKETGKQAEKDLGQGVAKGLVTLATKASPQLGKALTQAFTYASAEGGTVLAAAGVAAAPLIAASLSAAVIGGAGLGGVIGGVLLAAQDPRVQAAGTKLGENLLSSLKADAAPFVEPVLTAIGRIQAKADELAPRFQRIFGNSSQYLGPLVTALLHGVDSITAGFDKLIANAGPVMAELGQDITQITAHTGDFLKTLSGGSEGAAAALRTLTNGITLLEDILGPTILGLTKLYGLLDQVGAATGAMGVFADIMGRTGDETTFASAAAQTAQAAIAQVGVKAATAAGPVATFSDDVHSLAEAGHAAFDSLTSVGEATARAREAIKQNGKTLDENTAKGRANRTALSGLASALVKQYEATVQVNGEGAKSNAIAAQNRAAFVKLAAQFGLSRQKALELATQMGLIPPKKNTTFTANTHDAEGRIQALKEKISSVKGKSVSVNVIVNASRLTAVENRLARLHGGGLYGSSDASFSRADSGGGRFRTGGPTPVEVSNNIYLDGAPFYAITRTAVDQAQSRQAWRAKVGRR